MDIEPSLVGLAAHSPTSGRAEVNKVDFVVHVIWKNSQLATRKYNY
jgi:hypothetical protein